jgi:opacity protein-like surface antigen
MKRSLLLTVLTAALLYSASTQAQIPGVSKVTQALPKVDLGIKVGANFNQLSGNDFKQAYQPGIVAGAFVGLRKGKIGVRVEGLISSAKYTYAISSTKDGTFKNVYLDIPVLFEYKLVSRLWAQIGPQFSNTLSVTQDPAPPSGTDPKSYFKSSFAGVLGLEAKLPVHITVGARYILGMTDIHNESFTGTSGAWKARTIQAYIGFRFL